MTVKITASLYPPGGSTEQIVQSVEFYLSSFIHFAWLQYYKLPNPIYINRQELPGMQSLYVQSRITILTETYPLHWDELYFMLSEYASHTFIQQLFNLLAQFLTFQSLLLAGIKHFSCHPHFVLPLQKHTNIRPGENEWFNITLSLSVSKGCLLIHASVP